MRSVRRSHRGYSGYRGRRTAHDTLRIVAAVLGVLVILSAAALFYVQNYLVYTDDGVRVDLPFGLFQGEDALPDPGDVSVVEQTGRENGAKGKTAAPAPADGALRAAELPLDSLLDGTAPTRLEELGADALVVELKDGTGRLAWHSEQPLAEQAGVNGDEAVNRALEALEEAGVTVIARLTCFQDDALPDPAGALDSGGVSWRDALGLRWMSPASGAARDYLAGLCGELAALGVDEIVLEQFTFPVQGDLSRIAHGENYDPDRLAGQVEAFLAQVQAALEPYGASLSLALEGRLLNRPEDSGLTDALVRAYAARIWAGEGELSRVRLEELGGQAKLVQTADQLGEADGAQAALLP